MSRPFQEVVATEGQIGGEPAGFQLFEMRAQRLAVQGGHQVGGGHGKAGTGATLEVGLPVVRRVNAKAGSPGKDGV